MSPKLNYPIGLDFQNFPKHPQLFLNFDDSKESYSNSNKNQLICLKCLFQNFIYKSNFSAISKSIFKCNTIFCIWQNLLLKAGVNSFTGHPVYRLNLVKNTNFWWDNKKHIFDCILGFGSQIILFSAGRIFLGKKIVCYPNTSLYMVFYHIFSCR